MFEIFMLQKSFGVNISFSQIKAKRNYTHTAIV